MVVPKANMVRHQVNTVVTTPHHNRKAATHLRASHRRVVVEDRPRVKDIHHKEVTGDHKGTKSGFCVSGYVTVCPHVEFLGDAVHS